MTCQLLKVSGLYSSLGTLSLQGLSPGPVLGFSVKAEVHVKAVLTSLNTAFLPISWSRFKRH